MTQPEGGCGSVIRDGRCTGAQHPIGPYVIDFYCPAARLAVEIDGWSHAVGDRLERDERRDAWLRQPGIRTLRIPAVEVMQRWDETVERVVQAGREAVGS